MSIRDEPKLTPTQDLIMGEVAARHRLGEPFWSMNRKHLKAIRGLEALGLATWREHNASHQHVYVTLTEAGRDLYISPTYTPPLVAEVEALRKKVAAAETFWALRRHFLGEQPE